MRHLTILSPLGEQRAGRPRSLGRGWIGPSLDAYIYHLIRYNLSSLAYPGNRSAPLSR